MHFFQYYQTIGLYTYVTHDGKCILTVDYCSTSDVVFHCNALLAIRVKFFVSAHLAFSMTNFVVFTVISDFNKFGPSYQDTFDKGLLEISLVRITLLLSLTIVAPFSTIKGLSARKKYCKLKKLHI